MRRRTLAPSHAQRRGVALVDVIIGGVLLAVGLAAVISLTTRALKTQTDGEKQLIASWLADELLSMALVEGPVNYPKIHDENGRFEFPFEEFTYDVALDDQGVNRPHRVLATVYWDEGDRWVQVESLISERGGDPDQPRAPFEPVDREERWYGEDEER